MIICCFYLKFKKHSNSVFVCVGGCVYVACACVWQDHGTCTSLCLQGTLTSALCLSSALYPDVGIYFLAVSCTMLVEFHTHSSMINNDKVSHISPFLTVAWKTSVWYSCKNKPNTNDCMRTLSRLLDILYYCTHRFEWKLLNVFKIDWKWGATGAERASWCDEIHLNVLMISVHSPPGCIFVTEEQEKGLSTWRAPAVIWTTSALRRGQVKQCVPYLKNEAFIGTCLHIIIKKP